MLSARLVLVRHGQSTYNAQRPSAGPGRPAAVGRRARRGARRCAPLLPRFEQVVTSDLRARERDRGAARLSRTRGATRAGARSPSASGQGRPLADFPDETECAWRGGAAARRRTASRGREFSRARRRRGRRAGRRGRRRGSSSATAASSAPRSPTSPAPTRGRSPARRTPASPSSGPARRRGWSATPGRPLCQRSDVQRNSPQVLARGRRFRQYAALILGPLKSGYIVGTGRPAQWGRRVGRLPHTFIQG